MSTDATLLYFADPMCSWCWGFAPVIEQIAEDYAEQLNVRAVAGGLRAGETRPMTEALGNEIKHHWQQVAAATGQPFQFEGALPEGFVYDTEPACRALVTVRSIAPEKSLSFLGSIQAAFYRDGRDIKQTEVLAEHAVATGVDEQTFIDAFTSPDMAEQTRADFALTVEHGVSGFPTLVLDAKQQKRIISMGYQPIDNIRAQIERRLT